MSELVIGKCAYCQETVFESESLVENDTVLLHTDCENDVMAEIQAARGEY